MTAQFAEMVVPLADANFVFAAVSMDYSRNETRSAEDLGQSDALAHSEGQIIGCLADQSSPLLGVV